MTLIEQLKEWESRMTPEEVSRAIDFMRAQGWQAGSQPPAYVWAEAYRHIAPSRMPNAA